MCLDIFKDPKPFTRREVPVRLLHKELRAAYQQQASPDLSRKGRIFLVEDIFKSQSKSWVCSSTSIHGSSLPTFTNHGARQALRVRQIVHYRASNARFLAATVTSNSVMPCERRKALKEDYEFIQTEVFEHGERLEAMVPLVTSAASLIESRPSLSETANVTRLTILAIVFIPLSYVASIFSMSENLWAWRVVILGVFRDRGSACSFFIGLIAKPPVKIGKKVLQMPGIDKMLQWVSGNKKT
jgi:hypothetical protein